MGLLSIGKNLYSAVGLSGTNLLLLYEAFWQTYRISAPEGVDTAADSLYRRSLPMHSPLFSIPSNCEQSNDVM